MKKRSLGQQEQKFGSHKKRISRLLGIILFVTVAVIVAALWASFHRKKTALTRPEALPQNVNRRLSGYTFTRSEEGHQIFTIHAARTLAYGQGTSTVLEDVHVTVFGRSGNRHDQIQTERCQYDNSTGALACSGKASIKLESQPRMQPAADLRAHQPLFLDTSDVSYDPRRSEVTTRAVVHLHFGPATGTAVGLRYNTRDGSLALLKNVRFDFPPGAGRKLAMQISAGSLTYQKQSNQVELESPVSMTEGPRRLTASTATIVLNTAQRATQITLHGVHGVDHLPSGEARGTAGTLDAYLDPATEHLRQLIASEGTDLHYFEAAGGGQRRLTAERVQLNFAGRQPQPVSGSATGNFRLVSDPAATKKAALARQSTAASPANGKRILRGSELLFKLRPGGALEEAHTTGPGELDLLPENSAGDRQTITAGQFLMAFDAQGRLTDLQGLSSTRIVNAPPANAPRGKLPRESSADRLEAVINPATEAIRTLRQQGNFQFTEGDRRASADAAVYESQGQQLTLVGHPQIWNSDSRIRAQHIVMNIGTGAADGWGKVQSVHFEPGSSSTKDSGPAQGNPIIVLADKMIAKRDQQTIHYEGNVRAWRGASVVESSSLDVSKKQQRLTSGHGVVTSLIQPSSRATGTSSHASKAAQGATQPIVISADRLIYFNLGRKAVYQGHVQMKSEDTTFHADQMQIYFSKPSPGKDPEVERAVASGHVQIVQLPGRHASGEHAEYFASTGKIVLTGGPPFVYDPQQGFLTGQRLTFFIHDASLFADGGKKSQTLSKRRILQQ